VDGRKRMMNLGALGVIHFTPLAPRLREEVRGNKLQSCEREGSVNFFC
jgi:hypothetical protein